MAGHNANMVTLTVGDELSRPSAHYTAAIATDDQGNVVAAESIVGADANGDVVAAEEVAVGAAVDDDQAA